MAKLRRFSGAPVAEGVRLEVDHYTIFAVRNADKDISVRLRREPRALVRALMRVPLLRGMVRLVRDVACFLDGLAESSELRPQRPVRGTKAERVIARVLKIHPQTLVAWTSAVLIAVIAFVCLCAAPQGIDLLLRQFGLNHAALSAIVCAARIFAALLAIGCVGRLRVFRRLSMYKGAFNKVLNCYECGDELTPENAAQYPLHARRSEPAFLIGVLIFSLILFALLPMQGLLAGAATRLAMIFCAAAILNEPYAALEMAELGPVVRVLRAPMDFAQHITALEPHPQMLEVVVCAFETALGESGREVNPN